MIGITTFCVPEEMERIRWAVRRRQNLPKCNVINYLLSSGSLGQRQPVPVQLII